MKSDRYDELFIWQKAREVANEIYLCMKECKDYGFRDQLQRAAVSIMNNIAEGFERRSNKEFVYFLYISKGSCGEVRSMLTLGLELKKINEEDYRILYKQSEEISKMISGLISTL